MSYMQFAVQAQTFAMQEGFQISPMRAKKIAKAVAKRLDRFAAQAETSDEFKSITHSDITGETAVNNILRELLLSGTP